MNFRYEHCVFINCPFDRDYAALLDAALLAITSFGFQPRCALEFGASQPRLEAIREALFGSKYSLHDLSRCTGEGSDGLARFNMPLELEMAMSLKMLSAERACDHDWAVLVPDDYRHLKFVSDLAGFDPVKHDGRPETLITRLAGWLTTLPDAGRGPLPSDVIRLLPAYSEHANALRDEYLGQPPWKHMVTAAINAARRLE